jgi:dTDP-4-dehydrorhamnose reductase
MTMSREDTGRRPPPLPLGRAARVLLLGAQGRLGGALAEALPRAGFDVIAPSRQALALDPLAPFAAVERQLAQARPAFIVNGIAISDVDRCELEPTLAHSINTALPAVLARAADATDARLIHFSSDFVFDGALRRPYREDDAAHPLSVYGRTKLDGEQAIAQIHCRHWIFRVSWLYGAPRRNLAADLLDPANAGRVFRLAADRVGVPNPVQLLAAEVAACLAHEREGASGATAAPSGVYHLSCHGATTWHAFGHAFLRAAIRAGRLRAEQAPRIEAIEETALARPAPRPRWSVLDPARYERCFGRAMPGWEEAIATALPAGDGEHRPRGDAMARRRDER